VRTFLDFYTMARPGWLPLNVMTYFLLLIGCCAYALSRGGAPERIGAGILTVGSLLTLAVASGQGATFRSMEIGILVIDLACVAALVLLALAAERFWPLWAAAFQIISTAGHAVKYVDPDVIGRAYAFLLAFWAYPMVLLMFIGTWRHQQRLARFGADKSWSPQR
jgi:4-amino-4-deoxy-L-arabinose transferase-like glycosyltransferase